MRFLSVCSGIEAASQAWEPLGWQAHAFAEIEAFPSAVLAHHYPKTPNWGDMTKSQEWPDADVDVLVGGTPCQSFSVAGLRKGLADPRGNLALTFLAIAAKYSPRWICWENVPGVLSSEQGQDFGAFLGGLAECGYGWAYRVLDAQYFGIPQRRRRVFVVGYLGDWRRAAAVLFERHSLSGDTPPRREARKDAPAGTTHCPGVSGTFDKGTPARSGSQAGYFDQMIAGMLDTGTGVSGLGQQAANNQLIPEVSHCLNAGGMGRQDYETETLIAHSLRAEGFDASEDGTGRGTPLVPVSFTGGASECLSLENCAHPVTGRNGDPGMIAFTAKDYGADASDISPTLRSGSHDGSHANGGVMPAVAFAQNQLGEVRAGDVTNTLTTNSNASGRNTAMAAIGSAVRRLTPRECERLQGFPDDYTLIPYRGKPAADGPRYKALGNSMAVPCMLWLGQRIQMIEAIAAERLAA